MSVLAYLEAAGGALKKASFEAAYYAAKTAELAGTSAEAVVFGTVSADELASLGAYGITKVYHAADARFDVFDSKAFSKAVAEVAEKSGANYIVLSFGP